jgi:hypothetical protein
MASLVKALDSFQPDTTQVICKDMLDCVQLLNAPFWHNETQREGPFSYPSFDRGTAGDQPA